MSKKKVFMSVTASAVIASTFAGIDKVDAASHKVMQGDTLWSISQKYNTSVSQLIALNNLNNSIILPNQVIKVSAEKEPKPKAETKVASATGNASTYTVKQGDTLSKIAFAHGISIDNLMSWNNLNSTLIYPGNKLSVSKGATTRQPTTSNNSNANTNSNNSNTSSYTIKSGDSLSKIASAHGVSVNNLKTWNNLTSDLIFPGNKLVVSKSAASTEKPTTNNNNSSNTNPNSNTNSTKANTYTIKSGDTLSKIASAHGTSVNNLMAWNSLTSHIIYVGNTLVVSESATQSTQYGSSSNGGSSTSGQTSGSLIELAKSALGTSYVWGGSTVAGFDCSGFIYWAFKSAGSDISRLSTDGYYNRSYIINNPQVGDLVFFEGTYKSGISHMGIYLGNNQFIHAGSSTGVTIANLNSTYWNKHFHSFKRFY